MQANNGPRCVRLETLISLLTNIMKTHQTLFAFEIEIITDEIGINWGDIFRHFIHFQEI